MQLEHHDIRASNSMYVFSICVFHVGGKGFKLLCVDSIITLIKYSLHDMLQSINVSLLEHLERILRVPVRVHVVRQRVRVLAPTEIPAEEERRETVLRVLRDGLLKNRARDVRDVVLFARCLLQFGSEGVERLSYGSATCYMS
jgi:hypothetical protein